VSGRPARILIIAGSDSSGGAGIQADIKTATALGVYAMTAVTAVTVQDTTGVHAIHPIPSDIVRDQILACLNDIGADAIKTGMLGSAEMIKTVADTLSKHAKNVPLVIDPVMASTSGTQFLDDRAIEALKAHLLPLAMLVTPNIPEFAELTDADLADDAPPIRALEHARIRAVLVKGGHDEGEEAIDTLIGSDGTVGEFRSPRIETRHTHGTGCTLSTAIACGLGEGMSLKDAVERAHVFVHEALRTAPGFGRGHGPLNHMHGLKGGS
jgi:hydroxymethylpyrimidine/phosphomethylpyrimidine kinase